MSLGYALKHAKALWTTIRAPQSNKVLPQVNPERRRPLLKRRLCTKNDPRKHFKRIPAVSKARQPTSAAYKALTRHNVIEANKRGLKCPVVMHIAELRNGFAYGHKISARISETHHIFGRNRGKGPLLLDERLHLWVSRLGHRWIEMNKNEARKYGWLAPVGWFNRAVPQDAIVTRNRCGGIQVTLADGTRLFDEI